MPHRAHSMFLMIKLDKQLIEEKENI